MVNRSGRYHARLVVPKGLRGVVGKTELRTPLGGDYRQAMKLLPAAVAKLQSEITEAEQRTGGTVSAVPNRFPLTPPQMARKHYLERLAFDEEIRNSPLFTMIGIDDLLVKRLRKGASGHANDAELQDLAGHEIERFRALGHHNAERGSTEWRMIARVLCVAELEALERVFERDEGNFRGEPKAAVVRDTELPQKSDQPVSLKRLWADYVQSRVQAGFMRDNGKRIRPVTDNLGKFLKHDDAKRVTKRDLINWRDHLMNELSAKTVNDIYLSAVRSLFAWAVENDRLQENVAANIRQPKPKKQYARERGYTDSEATKVLIASRTYRPTADEFGNVRESQKMADMKRWVPILCAFSGARVSEVTQLRKEDIRQVDEKWVARITPDAGTVKAGGYRDVPLHPQIIEEGFARFLASAPDGPLFHNATDVKNFKKAAQIVSNKLSDWLRDSKLRPEGLQPNHAWRHRLKTQCRELGISDRVVDAIQGHSARTSSDNYGDVTLKTKVDAINKLPFYDLTPYTR
jgi:integrase